jgi:hypothetical protein
MVVVRFVVVVGYWIDLGLGVPLRDEADANLVIRKDGVLRGYSLELDNTSPCITRDGTIECQEVFLIKACTKTCDNAQVTLGRPECTRHDSPCMRASTDQDAITQRTVYLI